MMIVAHASDAAEEITQTASCGRGSARDYRRWQSRDQRERSYRNFFSNVTPACRVHTRVNACFRQPR
jgi:hypothetical protein